MFRVVHRQGARGGAAVEATPTEGEDQSCYRDMVLSVVGERGISSESFTRFFFQGIILCQ